MDVEDYNFKNHGNLKHSLYQLTNGELNILNNKSNEVDTIFDVGTGMDNYITFNENEKILYILFNYLGNAYEDFLFNQAFIDFKTTLKRKEKIFNIERDIEILLKKNINFKKKCNEDQGHSDMNKEVMNIVNNIDFESLKKYKYNVDDKRKIFLFEPKKSNFENMKSSLESFQMLREGYISLYTWEALRRSNNRKKYRKRPIIRKYGIIIEKINNLKDFEGIPENYKTFNFGIGNKEETVKFNENLESQIISNNNYTTTINIKVLNNFCQENKIDEIDYLKIDVEGNDLNVIKGASNLIKKIKFIQFELNKSNNKNSPCNNYTFEDVKEELGDSFDYYFIFPDKLYKINKEEVLKINPDYNVYNVLCINKT